jgi:hypothetical protein
MCSNSMRALWTFRSRLWRNLGRSETYMCAEGNPLQLLWRVVKEVKIGRAIGTRERANDSPRESE